MAGGLWINGEQVPYAQLPEPGDAHPPHLNEALSFLLQWQEGFGSIDLRTSGTTGDAKAHAFTREQLAASARLTAQTFGLGEENWAAVCLPLSGTGGKMQLVRGIVLGLWLHIEAPSGTPLEHLPEGDWATTSLVPLQLQHLLDAPEGLDRLGQFRFLLVGGAPLPPALAARLRELDLPLVQTYGLSETASHVAYRWLCGARSTNDYQLLEGVLAETDAEDRLLVTPSYLNLTSVFTGDRARMTAPNRFEILGRADDVINSGGLKHDPAVLEQAYASKLIEARLQVPLAVSSLPDEQLGERIVLVLETKETPQLRQDVSNLLGSLSSLKGAPRDLFFVEHLPHTEAGKLDRRALRELLLGL